MGDGKNGRKSCCRFNWRDVTGSYGAADPGISPKVGRYQQNNADPEQ